jgi:hypothetical protein
MKLHRNARLSVEGREPLVDRVENAGWSLKQAAPCVSSPMATALIEKQQTGSGVGRKPRTSGGKRCCS